MTRFRQTVSAAVVILVGNGVFGFGKHGAVLRWNGNQRFRWVPK